MSTEHAASRRAYYVVFLVLLACTYLTWQVAYFDLGPLNALAALGIAIFKATIVVLFFMHARSSPKLTWIVIMAGLFWLGILIALTASDYLTRNWL
jgi:cytochrome c oxidase subunit IV